MASLLVLAPSVLTWNAAGLRPSSVAASRLMVESSTLRSGAPSMDGVKSQALPFLPKPTWLDEPEGGLVGDVGFDPLGVARGYSIKYMREAELKHGRICMLAFLGFVAVDLGALAPGAPAVSSLAAHDATVKSGHMLFLLFVVGIFESLSYNAISEMMSGETDRVPGDYGFDPLGFSKGTLKVEPSRLALAEITHCRAAMLGFSGVVTQAALSEKGFPYF